MTAVPRLFCFLIFSFIVIFSNQFDWDHFLAFFEVERRSWLLDHELPLWSYQLCAGSTRLGDPQAFGLSPLFLFVWIFGSFWGAKLLTIFCTWIGYFSISKILECLYPISNSSRSVYKDFSLFFVLGGFFLWHLHTGQLTFALIVFLFFPILLIIKILQREKENLPKHRDSLFLFFSSFCFLSAGIYHSLVFFVMPLLTALVLTMVISVIRSKKLYINKILILQIGLPILLALVLSSYKWLGVLNYQREFPRDLSSKLIIEPAIGLWNFLIFQFSPTWNYQFLASTDAFGPYALWEYAGFSAIPILSVILLVGFFFKNRFSFRNLFTKNFSDSFWICLLIIAVFFSLGNSETLSLHHIFNKIFYQNSTRVIGRYQILFQISMLLACFMVLKSLAMPSRLQILRFIVPLGYVLTLFNLTSFVFQMDRGPFEKFRSFEPSHESKMTQIEFTKLRQVGSRGRQEPFEAGASFMYEPVLKGQIVANCYQPLKRERQIATEIKLASGIPMDPGGHFNLTSTAGISTKCSASIYVSQNKIHFDRSVCPTSLCFNLNMINPKEATEFKWNADMKRFCTPSTTN